MSTTFSVEYREGDGVGFRLPMEPECSPRDDEVYPTWESAQAAAAVHRSFCAYDICREYNLHPEEVLDQETPEPVEVNYFNARLVMDALGIEGAAFRALGDMPAREFMGRVLVALAVAPEDEGMPTVEGEASKMVVQSDPVLARLVGAAHVVVMEREEGFLQATLARLRDLAQYCIDHERKVSWG